jgi:AAHS family 4-hydroxybenzoate transporter-like MFS transporter
MTNSKAQRSGASPVDVAEFIDGQPIGGFQIRLLLTCAAVLFLDGFDTQAIGYVAPALAKEWSLTKGALGPVFSAGLFGLMIGALVSDHLRTASGERRSSFSRRLRSASARSSPRSSRTSTCCSRSGF